jgi:pimeloyl-ACP methyl ester carboxylesterase
MAELRLRRVCSLAAVTWLICAGPPQQVSAGASMPLEGLAQVNGVRLQYLDWGGKGPALILAHGLADNPHCFDDLAPALTDQFHVFAYARRGSGGSQVKGPYDNATLAEDLRGLMDALRIETAHLAGHSAGGNDITAMAARYPRRVGRIVYLDSGYDFADPDSVAAFKVRPVFTRPASASVSMDAYRAYEVATAYPKLDDIGRIEMYLRQKVVIQRDGSVQDRTPKEVRDELYTALFSATRDYSSVHSPVLTIYPEHWYPPEVEDPQRRRAALAYDAIWAPFREKSIARMRREMASVRVAHVPGAHSNFMLMSRQTVVDAMRQFLIE